VGSARLDCRVCSSANVDGRELGRVSRFTSWKHWIEWRPFRSLASRRFGVFTGLLLAFTSEALIPRESVEFQREARRLGCLADDKSCEKRPRGRANLFKSVLDPPFPFIFVALRWFEERCTQSSVLPRGVREDHGEEFTPLFLVLLPKLIAGVARHAGDVECGPEGDRQAHSVRQRVYSLFRHAGFRGFG
jgi:hypothetical protein